MAERRAAHADLRAMAAFVRLTRDCDERSVGAAIEWLRANLEAGHWRERPPAAGIDDMEDT